jgi:hypothetical protein
MASWKSLMWLVVEVDMERRLLPTRADAAEEVAPSPAVPG